ncbi:unnamed protein product, partial [marine sediment metagenome]
MPDVDNSGGHWASLGAAQKLTQSMKIPGVFEEDIKRNNPIERLTVGQAAHSGLKIEWLREKPSAVTAIEAAVADIDIGQQLSWTEDVDYDEKEMTLRTSYIQRKLDHYVQGIYGTYNNYEARRLLESEKGLKRKIGARIIYADNTFTSSKQFDGIHALAAEHGTAYDTSNLANDPKNIDNDAAAGLSLHYLRVLVDSMLHGVDELWAPFEIIRWMDAAYQEKGFLGLATQPALSFITMGWNDMGKRVLFWDGIPIIRTDYLVRELADSGVGTAASLARRLDATSSGVFSIFAIKHGNVLNQEPGLTYAYGGTEGLGDLYKLVRFPELEDYDAGGIR